MAEEGRRGRFQSESVQLDSSPVVPRHLAHIQAHFFSLFFFFPCRYSRSLFNFFDRRLSLLIIAIVSSPLRVLPVPARVLVCLLVSLPLSSPYLLMPQPSVSTHRTLIIPSYLLSSKSNVPSPPICHEKLSNTHFAVSSSFVLSAHQLKILCQIISVLQFLHLFVSPVLRLSSM